MSKKYSVNKIILISIVLIVLIYANVLKKLNCQADYCYQIAQNTGSISNNSHQLVDNKQINSADQESSSETTVLNKAAILELLASMYTTLNQLNRAALDLQSEASQSEYDGADLMTSAMVMQPMMGGPSGMPYVNKVSPNKDFSNVLPVRKKWVKFTYRQLMHVSGILNNEFAKLSYADFKDNQNISSYMAQCNVFSDTLDSVKGNIEKVKMLITHNNYDNKALYDNGKLISDDVNGLNEIRKRLIKDIKKLKLD